MKTFIDEKNLYRLIGRSDKPMAIKFMDWVYDVVLPAIRKTGNYSINGAQTMLHEEKVRLMLSLERLPAKGLVQIQVLTKGRKGYQ